MRKLIIKIAFISLFFSFPVYSENNSEFDIWLTSFKIFAKEKGISNNTIKNVLSKAEFLPKVIEYDRRQPEHYEDTQTYIENVCKTTQKYAKKCMDIHGYSMDIHGISMDDQ